MVSGSELKTLNELEKRKNESDFFDKFKRIEQKSRLQDQYPNVNNLIRLQLKGDLLKKIYNIKKYKVETKNIPIKGPNGELAGVEERKTYIETGETENPQSIDLVNEIYETIKLQKMEYSISIDGSGRKEFIKTQIEPKQIEDDEEKENTLVDKIADKLS